MGKRNRTFLKLYLLGFFIGIVFANLYLKKYILNGITDYGRSFLHLAQIKTNSVTYLFYLMRVRTIPVVILLVLGNSKYRKLAVFCSLLWLGILFGIMNAGAVMQLGWKGIVISFVSLMPHMIVYFMLYTFLITNIHYNSSDKLSNKKTVAVLLALCIGIALEYSINPFLVRLYVTKL